MTTTTTTRGPSAGPSCGVTEDRVGKVGSVHPAIPASKFGIRNLSRNTIAIGDVDGRAFDILLRYDSIAPFV